MTTNEFSRKDPHLSQNSQLYLDHKFDFVTRNIHLRGDVWKASSRTGFNLSGFDS
jgi:hypothetical protein